MQTDLIRIPRRQRAPLAAVGRRVGFAGALVLFVATVTRVNAAGYVDTTGDPIGFLDALYYASVTVTTTGYGDISAVSDTARLASIVLITPARILFLILVVGTTVEVLTDQSREYLAARRWRNTVRDHIVICGFGATGQSAAAELANRGFNAAQLTIVDTDPQVIEQALRAGLVAIEGDATHNKVLEQAAIRTAQAVIVTPHRDDTAVLVTLTARELNPGAHIVAAGREQENLHLLRQGGADEVIDATAAVGRMLGLATTAPGAVGVLSDLLDAGNGLEIAEVTVTDGNEAESAGARVGDTVLAVIRDGRRLAPSVGADGGYRPGDRLILLTDTTGDSTV